MNAVLQESNRRLAQMLASAPELSCDEARATIARYGAAISGQFIPWVAAALVTVRTSQAQVICAKNMYEEIRDAHPEMLKRFIAAANASVDCHSHVQVGVHVSAIDMMVREMNGVQNMALIALLEHTSAVFIPHLAHCAQVLGSSDLEYTNVHGVADIVHAQECIHALECESSADPDAAQKYRRAEQLVLNLWQTVFRPGT